MVDQRPVSRQPADRQPVSQQPAGQQPVDHQQGSDDPHARIDQWGSPVTERRVFLSVGSNMGDRRRYLQDAVESLPDVVAVSPVYETDPVGGPDQDPFLNLIVELRTAIAPLDLLGICHRVEMAADRVRDIRWGPRTVDLDIIWIDGVRMESDRLTIPHPRWRERRFVLAPLADLAPELVSEDDLVSADGRVTMLGEL